MRAIAERSNRFLAQPLRAGPRLLLLVAVVLLLPTYLSPLWTMTMIAPQHPGGLRLNTYSYKLEGGDGGQDLHEINAVNASIGMRELTPADFTEFQWMPFAVGVLALLFLRAAVHGKMSDLIDVLVLYFYFGLFSLWSFGYRLHAYGHSLVPTPSRTLPPFMPPMFGHKKIAEIEAAGYPAAGSYALVAVAVVLAIALFWAWRQELAEEALEVRAAG